MSGYYDSLLSSRPHSLMHSRVQRLFCQWSYLIAASSWRATSTPLNVAHIISYFHIPIDRFVFLKSHFEEVFHFLLFCSKRPRYHGIKKSEERVLLCTCSSLLFHTFVNIVTTFLLDVFSFWSLFHFNHHLFYHNS